MPVGKQFHFLNRVRNDCMDFVMPALGEASASAREVLELQSKYVHAI